MAWREQSAGLLLDPWRFDPCAAARAANQVIRAGGRAQALLHEWVAQSRDALEATAAVIAARLAVTPVPWLAGADTYRRDAPRLPHHPFIVSDDLPFLPVGAFEGGGAGLAPDDAIDACFSTGALLGVPFEPADPMRAASDLLRSGAGNATILEQAKPRASNIVRWQAVRALGRHDLLVGLDPATADDAEFDAWWQSCAARGSP
jgi:hypothetical protein